MTQLRTLYPPIEPFDTGRLQVSRVHELYYEQCGNPQGKPVVFLHGGPGGGISSDYRRYFDPQVYRVVELAGLVSRFAPLTQPGFDEEPGNPFQSVESCF